MFAPSIRVVIAVTRLTAGLFEGASLSLFALVIANVFDDGFPATNPGFTVLPAIALSLAILWNIAAIATLSRVQAAIHAIGDVATALFLVILGAIGFASDDKNYLSNGKWLEYDDTNWLVTETVAGTLLLGSFIMQFLLAFMSWHQSGNEKQEMQRRVATFSYRNADDGRVLKEEPRVKEERQVGKGAADNYLVADYRNFVNSSVSSVANPEEKV